MNYKEAQEKIRALTAELHRHADLYYRKDNPIISDEAYDALYEELIALEKAYPELRDPTSPTSRVGGMILQGFDKALHKYPQWSFDNVFSFQELKVWEQRLYKLCEKNNLSSEEISYVVELKIDGLKVVLDYEQGRFVRGATRGNGVVGEDITENLKTIRDIPLVVPEQRSFSVVAEAWISRSDFKKINDRQQQEGDSAYANPRNLAAGTLRQLDTKVVASRNLHTIAYDLNSSDIIHDTHHEELLFLKEQGFSINDDYLLTNNLNDIQRWYEQWVTKRHNQVYGIDGLVIKVDQNVVREAVGYTAKAPRFAIAYKFPAEQKTTTIEKIIFQIGRTGILTPVALLKPVEIDGSTVSRATLHNESEIQRLDLRIGDTVIIEKSGDIIPKVKEVLPNLRPSSSTPFSVEEQLKEQGIEAQRSVSGNGIITWKVEGKSGEVGIQNLIHFCSKKAMNIDGLGKETLRLLYEKGYVRKPSDLYHLTYEQVIELPLFKEKSTKNLLDSIDASRTVSFENFIFALGIHFVGEESARIYTEHFKDVETWSHASYDDLLSIDGIGEKTAASTISWLSNQQNRDELTRLLTHISLEYTESTEDTSLKGHTYVITGSSETYTRDELSTIIRNRGGKVSSSISSNTTALLVGEQPGSKLARAEKIGVPVVTIDSFIKKLGA